MSGSGIYRWADGRVFEGEFSDDNRHGLGVEIGANGAKTHGRWEKGVYKGLEWFLAASSLPQAVLAGRGRGG